VSNIADWLAPEEVPWKRSSVELPKRRRSGTQMRIPSCLCPKSMFAREMPPFKLSREEFEKRFSSRFADPVFKPLQLELGAIVDAGGPGRAIMTANVPRLGVNRI